jgi:uncharacterized protein (TIGR01370 family)
MDRCLPLTKNIENHEARYGLFSFEFDPQFGPNSIYSSSDTPEEAKGLFVFSNLDSTNLNTLSELPSLHFSSDQNSQPLSSSLNTIPRALFQVDHAAVFYGTVDLQGGTTTQTINSWAVDTLIISSRRAYNGLNADTYYNQGAMNDLRNNATQDVLAYVNVGKVDKYLDTYTNASSSDPWLGASNNPNNPLEHVFYANYWQSSWLQKLQTEVNFAVTAGASGLFLDDVGVYFETDRYPGRGVGTNARDMMQLIIDLAVYARDSSRGGSEFRIIVNGEPFIGNNSVFGLGGSPNNAAVFQTFRNAIDGIMFEQPFTESQVYALALERLKLDFGSVGKQVILVDNMKTTGMTDVPDGGRLLAETAASFGFIPLLVNPTAAGGSELNFITTPILIGLGTNRSSTGDDIITGTPLSGIVNGGPGNDKLYGQNGDDSLGGGSGNDTLIGGTGNDTMNGEAGNDVYYIDAIGDLLQEVAGNGFDLAFTTVSYTLQAGSDIEVLAATSSASMQGLALIGNNINNQLLGTGGSDTLVGGLGNDGMYGYGGSDSYSIDAAFDTIVEAVGGGLDSAFTSVSYTLTANAEVEYLGILDRSSTSPFLLFGNSFNNQLAGASGLDTLVGGAGADTLYGFGGNDVYYVDNVGDVVVEATGAGTDTIFTSGTLTLAGTSEVEVIAAQDTNSTAFMDLGGNEFNNVIIGNAASNLLIGNAGNDTIYGQAGDDLLVGGLGNDVLVGGAGNDVFNLGQQFGGTTFDIVTDYVVANDQVRLSNAAFPVLANGSLPSAAFTIGTAATTAAHRIIYNSTTGDLLYDADGTGTTAATMFANIGAGLAMTASEFLVV